MLDKTDIGTVEGGQRTGGLDNTATQVCLQTE